jgi:predicted PhzF superfamily epimerase YddE/YHI9
MHNLKCFLYDLFSEKAFGGNVAGAVLLERSLNKDVLQSVAEEINAPTTGFVELLGPDRYRVRFSSRSKLGTW